MWNKLALQCKICGVEEQANFWDCGVRPLDLVTAPCHHPDSELMFSPCPRAAVRVGGAVVVPRLRKHRLLRLRLRLRWNLVLRETDSKVQQ